MPVWIRQLTFKRVSGRPRSGRLFISLETRRHELPGEDGGRSVKRNLNVQNR